MNDDDTHIWIPVWEYMLGRGYIKMGMKMMIMMTMPMIPMRECGNIWQAGDIWGSEEAGQMNAGDQLRI